MRDYGEAPELKGAAKDKQRRRENRADYDMHSASPRAYQTSGIETAMSDHADLVHPVKARKSKKPRR